MRDPARAEERATVQTCATAGIRPVLITGDHPLTAQAIASELGIAGADVAKGAADMVLRDDNFATIVAAVEEGRVIYDYIRKFIKYLLTSNAGELWPMLLAPLLGMPLPLLPLQILWMNW